MWIRRKSTLLLKQTHWRNTLFTSTRMLPSRERTKGKTNPLSCTRGVKFWWSEEDALSGRNDIPPRCLLQGCNRCLRMQSSASPVTNIAELTETGTNLVLTGWCANTRKRPDGHSQQGYITTESSQGSQQKPPFTRPQKTHTHTFSQLVSDTTIGLPQRYTAERERGGERERERERERE